MQVCSDFAAYMYQNSLFFFNPSFWFMYTCLVYLNVIILFILALGTAKRLSVSIDKTFYIHAYNFIFILEWSG